MGDIADEIAADRLQPADTGQILQDDQIPLRSPTLEGCDKGLQKQVVVTDLNRLDLFLALISTELPQIDQLVVGYHLGKRAPQCLFF